jgi:UDP-glucuronate 4-epimerase
MILVTGVAGFIGFHVCKKLLDDGQKVIGVDNLNEYYDVQLKHDRLKIIQHHENFQFYKLDIADYAGMSEIFNRHSPEIVINLAAQAGVRYSIENPSEYIQSNIVGFANILEISKISKVKNFVYASSSSVYGANTSMPFSETDSTSHQLSLYAATKKSNEVIAHSYSSLFGMPTTGLRFFTVYGPWGRPDMALFKFTKAILEDKEFSVFNFGNHNRDFTYIDDIVDGVVRCVKSPAQPNPDWNSDNPDNSSSNVPWNIYNIGSSAPIKLLDYVAAIERCLGKKANYKLLPLQPGDVPDTYSSISLLNKAVGYSPTKSVEDGVSDFIAWYRSYYGNRK